MDFLDMLQKVGFENAELVAKTGFNSTPKTEGVLLRAVKSEPATSVQRPKEETVPYEEAHVMEGKPSRSIEAVMDKAYALWGARKQKLSIPAPSLWKNGSGGSAFMVAPSTTRMDFTRHLLQALMKQEKF